MRQVFALAALALAAIAPAHAETLRYTAALDGAHYPTTTGSTATGAATLSIDTEAQTINAQIEIHGVTLDALAQHLSHSRMGPMHLHRYQGDDVTLILPFPSGDTYAATADGFTVTVTGYPYADGAERTGSHLSFAQFLAALGDDPIYLNVHTEAFRDGEISGRVVPAS